METADKLALIKRNLQEITDEPRLDQIVSERPLSVYWGSAITGRPHIAYLIPFMKLRDFLNAGCTVKILLADIHGFMDSNKAPIDKIEQRCAYYERLFAALLRRLGVDTPALTAAGRLTFVRGTSYQTSPRYAYDLYRLSSLTTVHDAIKAGAQVVKQSENPPLGALLYPNMQALDEEYLGVDAQFGGVDQRKIFMHANKYLPKLNFERRIHLMNPMLPGLTGEKMSASDEASKIDFRDEAATIRRKIAKCFCEPQNKETGVLKMLAHVVYPLELVTVTVAGVAYKTYGELEAAFVAGTVHPKDLKDACVAALEEVIAPIRAEVAAGAVGGSDGF